MKSQGSQGTAATINPKSSRNILEPPESDQQRRHGRQCPLRASTKEKQKDDGQNDERQNV